MGNKSFFEKLGGSLKLEDERDESASGEESIQYRDYQEDGTPAAAPNPTEEEPMQEEIQPQEETTEEEMPTTEEDTPQEQGDVALPIEEETTEVEPIEEEPTRQGSEEVTATLTSATVKPRKKTAQKTTTAPKAKKPAAKTEGRLTVDVYETPSEIIVKSTIAGVEQDNIDINVTTDSVTIRGEREQDERISTDAYFYQECYWGAFSRSILLPTEIDPDKAKASIKNGILTVRLPKLSRTDQRKLKVQAE